MKVSQALLAAILAGVTVQSTSCTKSEQNELRPIIPSDVIDTPAQLFPQPENPDPCPACGMG